MGIVYISREWFIRRTLKRVARQRVAMLLQPGNVWVIERAIEEDENTAPALRTCHMRGWIEPISDAVPCGKLSPDGSLPHGQLFSGSKPLYRLTDAGWNAIHRTHSWVLMTFAVAFASLVGTIVGIWLSVLRGQC